MRNIYLYGALADEFVPHLQLEVLSVSEAVRALEANFPSRFSRALSKGEYVIVKGSSLAEGEEIPQDMLDFGLGKNDLHILPALEGAKSGFMTFLIGALILAAAFFTAGAALSLVGAASGVGMTMGTAMASTTFLGISMGSWAMFGASLMLQGVQTMLSPKVEGGSAGKETKSYVMTGLENISYQGGCVPLAYGTPWVGSTVIATSLTAEDIVDG